MRGIYGSPSYQLGAAQIGGQLGDVSKIEKATADREIKKMRSALEKWLRYRTLLELSPATLSPVEVRLGQRLYVLLSEMFDAQTLPAASDTVALARVAVSGKLANETAAPHPTGLGLIWMWPAVAVVGLVLLTVVTKIRSDADDAADARKTECIMAGKCTDYGFWLKVGGVAAVAWLAWEKLGLKKLVKA